MSSRGKPLDLAGPEKARLQEASQETCHRPETMLSRIKPLVSQNTMLCSPAANALPRPKRG